jgi:F-type H+-transporting ATPase subunit delta
MSNKIASRRYAVALFDTVQNEQLDALLADSQSLSSLIQESQELASVLKSPLTKNEIKSNILLKIIEGVPSEKTLKGLVNTLRKNKRLNLFENILIEFQDVLFEKRGYQKAKVTTAHPINDETKNNIKDLLNNQYGSKINLEFQINQALLGGMTVVVGSKMIDLSVLNQVSKFTNNVKGDI